VGPGLLSLAVFVVCLTAYVTTLAPGTLFGDPSEYQFIPALWGIAHPPGYAFWTLLAGVWQRVVRLGTVAWRTNLLAAVTGAWAASRVTAIVWLAGADSASEGSGEGRARRRLHGAQPGLQGVAVVAVVAGLAAGLAADVWQHSIHANAHIVSAALTVTHLWLLVGWWRAERNPGSRGNAGRWSARGGARDGSARRRHDWRLYVLALLVGVGVTHHPITVFGVPAYVVFIVLCRPRIVLEWRTVLLGVASGLVGLAPWLYFPLRSPRVPFGPTDMATWDGFLRHATAQGLRVNLFHFGWLDQPDRLQVFTSLANLQYGWVLLAAALVGLVWLLATRPRVGVLWVGFLACHLVFTMNSVQDVMAYLMHAFVAMGVPVGLGVLAVARGVRIPRAFALSRRGLAIPLLGLAIVVGRTVLALPVISMRDWDEADASVAALHERFDGTGEGSVFVSDWEHLTPYFYHTMVEEMRFDVGDLTHVYVTGETPWVESVFGSLPKGPVYLSNYRRDVREAGFRLRPAGDLWQVLEPGDPTPVTPMVELEGFVVDERLELVGFDVPMGEVAQGARVPGTVYARVLAPEPEILMPVAWLGEIEQRWTTDSRRLTPEWQPGEVIVERYEVGVPFDVAPGEIPLRLGYEQVSGGRRTLSFSGGAETITLGTLRVVAAPDATRRAGAVARSLTNLGNEVALVSSWAWAGPNLRSGVWADDVLPLPVRAGSVMHLRLRWQALARPTTSYTVFIHLIDAQGRPAFGHDYTPLGGAFPSYLWFPKWLPGQSVVDPYTLRLPETLAPGRYTLEVGMYEMGSIRRVPHYGVDGTLVGDRLVLGSVEVRE